MTDDERDPEPIEAELPESPQASDLVGSPASPEADSTESIELAELEAEDDSPWGALTTLLILGALVLGVTYLARHLAPTDVRGAGGKEASVAAAGDPEPPGPESEAVESQQIVRSDASGDPAHDSDRPPGEDLAGSPAVSSTPAAEAGMASHSALQTPAAADTVVGDTESAHSALEDVDPSAQSPDAVNTARLDLCGRIGRKLGSVDRSDCVDSRLATTGARSVNGAPILMAEFPPLAARESLGRVLLFGGIHGDEYSSVSIVFKWLSILQRNHSGMFHWRVVPLLNPDGLLRSKAQRMNEHGVDLNRNFPSPNWHVEASDYWIRRTSRNPRRYPGTDPLSEPESQWLFDQIQTFRPSAIVSVHAPSKVVDYDGPPEPPEKLGSLYLKQMGTYPGSLGRYAGVHLGLPVVTIELPSAGIMVSEAEQLRIWRDLIAWLKVNVPKQRPDLTAAADADAPAEAETPGLGGE